MPTVPAMPSAVAPQTVSDTTPPARPSMSGVNSAVVCVRKAPLVALVCSSPMACTRHPHCQGTHIVKQGINDLRVFLDSSHIRIDILWAVGAFPSQHSLMSGEDLPLNQPRQMATRGRWSR